MVDITEPLLIQTILCSLPQSLDNARKHVFQKYGSIDCATQLVELLETEEMEMNPLWMEFRRGRMSHATNVIEYVLNKEKLYHTLKRQGFRPTTMFSVQNDVVNTLPLTWPIKSILQKIRCRLYDMTELVKLLQSVEKVEFQTIYLSI